MVSAPHRHAQTAFSTSSSMLEVTAEFPMFAFNLYEEITPYYHGFAFGVVYVVRNYGAPRGDFLPYELGE